MIAISIFDKFYFAFHPLEKNIFLDQDRFDNKVLVSNVFNKAKRALTTGLEKAETEHDRTTSIASSVESQLVDSQM